jgi:hypothetical protein
VSDKKNKNNNTSIFTISPDSECRLKKTSINLRNIQPKSGKTITSHDNQDFNFSLNKSDLIASTSNLEDIIIGKTESESERTSYKKQDSDH